MLHPEATDPRKQEGGGGTAETLVLPPRPRPIRVYVSGPYTLGDVAVNVRRAIFAADELADAGLIPYIPHLSHFWHLVLPRPYEWWLSYDLEWLKVCDAVLRLDGESRGADLEVETARSLGIPVYHSIEELLSAMEVAECLQQPPKGA